MWQGAAVCWALVSVVLTSITIGPLEPIPDKLKDAEGCYISDLDVLLAFNETLNTECQEISCDIKAVTYTSCGLMRATEPCEVLEDKDKPYPECCPRIKCPDLVNPTELVSTE
ncbi:uncharacterized protein LOC114242672 [Bombyx mandarina]|uniref:Uncharacterized protein LOC114242672 n=1 Tax=Bombyx mandarina TaxID=7092 RepID=A0A6J2JN21_BOMMA|nr:uncharacterized protein LOC114242672 [Bombyx mandarina]XP_028029729.1 uncharacterized protein LOC114242672 [Bombyx mandarina]